MFNFSESRSVLNQRGDYSRLFVTIRDCSYYSLFAIRVFQTPESRAKIVAIVKTKMQLVYQNINLEMNKFTEDECLPNFEFKFRFLENVRIPLRLKSTRKCVEERNNMAETREESQKTVFAEENQISVANENQKGFNVKRVKHLLLGIQFFNCKALTGFW